ncbi:MAG: GntR family transcriptional regulator [Armatimonadia bacterium]|nr:GntR family transcriptional regulator [Armatimonadia bacterium]
MRVEDVNEVGRGPSQLLGVLRAHAWRTGRAWPRQDTLARELGVSVRTIRRWLRELETRGLIHIQRTGRSSVITFPDDHSEGAEEPNCSDTMSGRTRREKQTNQRNEVSSATAADSTDGPSPPAPDTDTTTTISDDDSEQLLDAGDLRRLLAETRQREREWVAVDPEAPERRQARQRGRALQVQLAWLEDIQRAAERIQRVPGYGYRGDGGVDSLGALWALRERHGSMGEEWLPSVRAWCAWWSDPKRRGRILSLDRWLARERFREVDVPELVPLPDAPVAEDEDDDLGEGGGPETPWEAAIAALEELGLPLSVAQALEEAGHPVDGRLPRLDPLRQGALERWLRSRRSEVEAILEEMGVTSPSSERSV